MITRLKKGVSSLFFENSFSANLILILAASIFLPLYITLVASFVVLIFFLKDKGKRAAFLKAPFFPLYAFLGLQLLIIPLIYKNYYGFGCGIAVDVYFILAFYILRAMTEKLFNQICSVFCIMSVICVIVGIIERLSGMQTRVMAMTYNANFYGYIIELMVLVCFYKFSITKKPVFLFIFAANMAALFLTDCRSAWSALFVGLFAFFCIQRKKGAMITLGGIAGAIALAIYIQPKLFPRINDFSPTVSNRVFIWSHAFKDFLSHPVFGRGLLAFYQVTGNPITPHAHNIPIDLLECTGIVGTAIIAFFFVQIIRQLAKSFKSGNTNIRACVALCGGVIFATLTHGITDMPIMGVQTGLFFLMLLAMRPVGWNTQKT